MQKKIRKQIALFLAALLFLSPFSETTLYAAPEETTASSETETEQNIESDIESKIETESEPEESGAGDGAEITAESSAAEIESETISEEETESIFEDTSESISEIASEIEYSCPAALELENVPYDENQEEFTRKLLYGRGTRNIFPVKYDAREEGYLPVIRDQGSWDTCWSFSLLGAMEAAMIRDMEIPEEDADLSERHLAYFGFNTGYDVLDNANGDTMTSPENYYLRQGGNDVRGVVRLMNWNGGAAERDYPYPEGTPPNALERTDAQDAAVYLENSYRYDFARAQDKDEAIHVVKKMIMDYGTVSWSYYHSSNYLNQTTGAYYNSVGGTGSAKTNHAIMAVGWDDNYSKENFKEGNQPEKDGAWIIRNSWGENRGDNGYFYISYEDVSLGSANPVYAVTVCDTARYDNNYFYGNTAFSTTSIKARRVAQVYTMKSEKATREELTAVSLFIGTSDVDYELQVYRNPDTEDGVVTNPSTGTPMLDSPQKGTLSYAGLHTIALNTPVTFDVGDRVSVVLTFPDTKPSMYFDRSGTSNNGQEQGVHVIAKGQNFYGPSLTSWEDDYNNNRTFRINALTVDCDDIVPEIKRITVAKAQDFNTPPTVHITWSASTAADGYKIYRSDNNEDYVLIDTVNNTVKSYVDSLPDRTVKRYYYKVAAVCEADEMLSDAASGRVDGKIEATKCTYKDYDGDTAVLTWNEVAGADGYEIWKLFHEEGKYVRVADLKEEAFSGKVSVDDWGHNYYKVRAKQGNVYTDWSEVCIYRDLRWEQREYDEAYFEWQPVQGAVSYKLCHRVNGKSLSVTKTDTHVTLSMKSTMYLPCDEHQYYVEAYDAANAGGNKIYTSSTITFHMIPGALTINSAVYDYGNEIALSWSGGSGADKIMIYRSEKASESGSVVAEPGAGTDSYNDTVYRGKTYYYTLIPIAISSSGEQVQGNFATSGEILAFPDMVMLDTAQYLEETGVKLAWNAAKGADGYLIERSDNNDGFTVIATIDDGAATAYTDKTAKKGNRYQYRMMSYCLTEDKSKAATSAQNEITVEILPEPVTFSEIKELKRANEAAQVGLFWDAAGEEPSYAVYRCPASEAETGNYECIAEEITQNRYIDNTAEPDTAYSYKLIAVVNGLASEIEKTKDWTIVTKPLLTALNLSIEYPELVKDTEQTLAITPVPMHYPYKQELVWSAWDEEGNKLTVTQKDDTTVINGVDGKEILFLSDNKIHAVQNSETVRITLTASIDEISASCKIFVYSNDFWVTGIRDVTYTGSAVRQKICVYDGKMLLTEGVDYTVTYRNNVKISTDEVRETKRPAVIVKGKGSYTGTQTLYFKILPESAEDAQKISVLKANVSSIKTFAYQGEAIKPKPVVKYRRDTLTEGVDYTLSYENNDRAGTATVVINGINDYKGTKRVNFKINYDLQNDSSGLISIRPDEAEVPYRKGGAKPVPEVYCGSRLLKEGTDYKISYKNNKAIAAASDKKAPTIIITGKGSYKGKKEAVFSIVQQDIGMLTLTAKDKVYVDKAGKFTTSFVITDKDGKKLSPGKDYDKTSVTYAYADTGMPVAVTDVVPKGTKLRITVKAAEAGAYRGTLSGEYRIAAYDIGKAKVTIAAQTYTGSAIEPDSDTGVAVRYNGYADGLIQNVHYEITGYDNNTQKGTATLYLRGKGDFCGTKAVRFKIKTKRFRWWWQNE